MASSILDVAREANVAPSTVSLVVNGKANVSDETRSQVKAVIRRLHYKPRRAKRLSRIAVVYTQNMIVNGALAQYCRGWIAGIREGVQFSQAQVSIYAGLNHVDQDLVFTQSLDHHECDGVIVMGAYPKHGYLERVLASGLPTVVFARYPLAANFSAVCVDYQALGSHVANHLNSLGHRKLALLTGPVESLPTKALRDGFFGALGTAQVAYDMGVTTTQPDDAFFDQRLDEILASGATATFSGDPAALRLANAMERRGLKPGIHLSLMGIDDMGLQTIGKRKITSMGYDKHVMGVIAGQMILQLMQMGDHISHQFTTVQPFLVQGDTLGPPLV